LGFIVRKIEPSGLARVERLGGVPERALASQAVLFCLGEGRDLAGVIANKSHHATTPEEKYRVLPYAEIFIDGGFASAEAMREAGIEIGTPVVYAPNAVPLARRCISCSRCRRNSTCAARWLRRRRCGRISPSSSTSCWPPTRPIWPGAARFGSAAGRPSASIASTAAAR